MRVANAARISLLAVLATLSGPRPGKVFGSPPPAVADAIRRGFYASGKCIHGGAPPLQWYLNFQRMLFENAQFRSDSVGFLLGANFGFSFRVESNAEAVGASQDELRRLAMYAALTRLEFEKKKKQLHLSDAEVIKLVGIDARKFGEWKARSLTIDTDPSVLKNQRGINL